MQAQFKTVFIQQLAHGGTALGIEFRQRVVAGIELDVDMLQAVLRRPGNGVFQFQTAADIDADAVNETHRYAPVN